MYSVYVLVSMHVSEHSREAVMIFVEFTLSIYRLVHGWMSTKVATLKLGS